MIIQQHSLEQAIYKASPKGKLTEFKYRHSLARKLAKKREYQKDYQKILVRNYTRRAIKKGLLTREKCLICADGNSHAHHEDYSKPLEIMWLCVKHHKERHQFIKLNQEVKNNE